MTLWSSGTNAVLTDQCQALGNFGVILNVSQHLVTADDGGFSLQLNCYPMPGVSVLGLPLNWIQFSLYVSNVFGNNTAAFQWQAWSLGATGFPQGQPQGTTQPQQPVPPFNQPPAVITNLPSNRLPKGSSLAIDLVIDTSSHGVTQAVFTVGLPGAELQFVTLVFPASIPFNFTTGRAGVPVDARFPIGGFRVNLVGPGNLSNAAFTSGAGLLLYASDALSVQSGGVGTACGQYAGAVTGETSNILYGPVITQLREVSQSQSFGLFRAAKTISLRSASAVYVIGGDGNLWLEQASFGPGHLPPSRTQVDANAVGCSAVDANTVYVLGSDGNLWLEQAPFGAGHIPPKRTQVDDNVVACSPVDVNTVYVVGSDGNLWLEQAPFGAGHILPKRTQIDSDVIGCSAVDANTVYVLGSDGKLWLEKAPFGAGHIPPNRTQVDASVVGCSAVDANEVYVLGSDGNLWLEQAPFGPGHLPPQRTQVDFSVML